MPQFKKYKLGELIERITSGGTPSTSIKEYYGGNIPWLKTQEVDFNRIYKTETFITEEGLKNSSAKLIKENSVIIAMYGNTAAKVAINKIPLTTNQACCNITLDKTKVDYRFIYYYFLNEYENLKSLANGGAQQNLNSGIIRDYDIEAPDLPTQTRIASILSLLDDKIELNRRTNHTLEQIAQTLFKKYFVDDIDPDNLPEGWRWGKLGDVCIYNQKTLSKNDKMDWINYVEISEVNKGYLGNIARYKRGTEPSRARRILNHGDTVLSTVRPDRGSYFLAINPDKELLVSTGFAVFNATQTPYSFIYLFLTQEESISYYGFMAHGAAYPAINPEIILRMEIPIPPKEIFAEFHAMVESQLLKFHSNTVESKSLSQLRDSLLPKLMSGEIEVTVTEKELVNH